MVSGEQYIEDMHKRYMSTEAEAMVQTFKAEVPSAKRGEHHEVVYHFGASVV